MRIGSLCARTSAGNPSAETPAPAAELPPTAAFAIADLDASKNVCDNLADFVNSKWLAANPIPSDRTTWGSFEMLGERSLAANKQIAEILHLAEKTVESHRANLLRKLGMRDRVELVRYAIRRGLTEA